ncbi:Penicillin-binding protein, dimerization domain protein, partial [Candidatus Magnetoovum chiemensis]
MRDRFISVIIYIGFIAIFLRLFDLMVIKHETFAKRLASQSKAEEEIQVRRGVIFDRLGRRLAVNLEQNSVFLFKNMMGEGEDVKLQEASKIVNVDYQDIKDKINKSK